MDLDPDNDNNNLPQYLPKYDLRKWPFYLEIHVKSSAMMLGLVNWLLIANV